MPAAVQDYCRQTATANVLDWHCDFGYRITPAELNRLHIPVLVVRGERANPAMVGMSEVLSTQLPQARAAVVAGASHFLISSDPADCASLLATHLQRASGQHTRANP